MSKKVQIQREQTQKTRDLGIHKKPEAEEDDEDDISNLLERHEPAFQEQKLGKMNMMGSQKIAETKINKSMNFSSRIEQAAMKDLNRSSKIIDNPHLTPKMTKQQMLGEMSTSYRQKVIEKTTKTKVLCLPVYDSLKMESKLVTIRVKEEKENQSNADTNSS